jgi:hypothetical protein
MRALGLLFCGLLFIQCKGVPESKSTPATQEALELEIDTLETVEVQPAEETVSSAKQDVERSIYGEDYLGIETAIGMYEGGGYYTEEEALQHLEKNWTAIYLNSQGSILRIPVRYEMFETEVDPFYEDCDPKYKMRVQIDEQYKQEVLNLKPIVYVSDLRLNDVKPSEDQLYYTLKSEVKSKTNDQGYNLNYYDFDWKTYKVVNQDTISQQLLKFNGFLDDPIIEPILEADIDGDGLKDLYASVASKYSYRLTVLFLSSMAESNQVLKAVAAKQEFGC